jgi:hypothetical protein
VIGKVQQPAFGRTGLAGAARTHHLDDTVGRNTNGRQHRRYEEGNTTGLVTDHGHWRMRAKRRPDRREPPNSGLPGGGLRASGSPSQHSGPGVYYYYYYYYYYCWECLPASLPFGQQRTRPQTSQIAAAGWSSANALPTKSSASRWASRWRPRRQATSRWIGAR